MTTLQLSEASWGSISEESVLTGGVVYIIISLIPHGSELKATAVESKLINHIDTEEFILRIHLK